MADRERIPITIWLLLAVFIALTVLAVVWGVAHVEDDIGARAKSALGDLPVTVAVEGRDATLTGSADPAIADQAERIVRNVRGVRRVDNDITLVADVPEGIPPAATDDGADRLPPAFEATVVDGVATLSGRVPNADAAAALIAAAEASYGAGNVVDQLEVADVTSPDWLIGLPGFLSEMSLGTGRVVATKGGVQITGVVVSQETSDQLGRLLASATGLPVTNDLEVVPLAAPSFSATKEDTGSTVVLTGELPSQTAIDSVVSAAEQIYGRDNVTNRLLVGEVDSPPWVDVLPGLFGRLTGLDPWELMIDDGVLRVAGQGPDDGTLGAAAGAFGDFEAAGLQVETMLEIDSESVATALTDLLEGSTTFETGSARLADEAMLLLDEAIVILNDNTSTRLTVEGHTDDVGDAASNLALSQERAQAVVDFLIAGGVDASRLTAIGFGEDRPIADNSTAEGRAANRRIEFIVEEGVG